MDETLLRSFVVLEDILLFTKIARHFHSFTGIHLKQLGHPPQELFEETQGLILGSLRTALR
jgi:hypothetical protein